MVLVWPLILIVSWMSHLLRTHKGLLLLCPIEKIKEESFRMEASCAILCEAHPIDTSHTHEYVLHLLAVQEVLEIILCFV